VRGNLEPLKLAERFYTQTEYEDDQESARRRSCLSVLSSLGGQRGRAQGARSRNSRAAALRDSGVRLFLTSECPVVRRFGDCSRAGRFSG
jgi:hypothetical protein